MYDIYEHGILTPSPSSHKRSQTIPIHTVSAPIHTAGSKNEVTQQTKCKINLHRSNGHGGEEVADGERFPASYTTALCHSPAEVMGMPFNLW